MTAVSGKSHRVFLKACALLAATTMLSACGQMGVKSEYRDAPQLTMAQVTPVQRAPTAMDTFRAMAPPQGMKYTQLFNEPLENDEDRFRRLENSVQALRNDFDTVMPAVVRLMELEEAGARQAAAAAAAVQQEAIAAEEKAAAPIAIAPPPANAPKVLALRIGDHGTKTRIVLDVTGKPEFAAVMDKDGKRMALAIPGVHWTIKREWNAKGGDLVAHYAYDDGKALFDLMSASKILSQSVIAGEGGRGYRVVIDIARVKPL